MEWIMALVVVLAAYFGLRWWMYEREKGAFLISDAREEAEDNALSLRAEKAERAARVDDDTDRKQPDIPVWRDKPQPKRLKE